MDKIRIVIIDPERDMAELLARVAEARGNAKCYVATRDVDAETLFREIPVDIVLVDLEIARHHGYRLLHHLKRLHPLAAVILLANLQQQSELRDYDPDLAGEILFKPITTKSFRKWLADFENKHLAQEAQ